MHGKSAKLCLKMDKVCSKSDNVQAVRYNKYEYEQKGVSADLQ